MNLHGIVSGAIGSVNPFIPALLQSSIGSTTGPDGTRAPAYAPTCNVSIQAQALTSKDLAQIDNLNIQGIQRAVYMNGHTFGAVRVLAKGGDLLTFDCQVWLVVTLVESWPDWCKAICTLQNGG